MWFKKDPKNNQSDHKIIKAKPKEKPLDFSLLKEFAEKSFDVRSQELLIGEREKFTVTLMYVNCMINLQFLSDYILKPLSQDERFKTAKNIDDVLSLIKNGGVYFPAISECHDTDQIINDLLSGQAALLFEQANTVIMFEVKGFDKRNIMETTTENVMNGAKDAFTETLSTNAAIIRRRLKSKQLVIEQTTIGSETNTSVAIIYLEGTAEDSLITEIKHKLEGIDILGISAPGAIEELLLENNSVFPQILNTERTDRFCSNIIEGRVGILIDGFPVGYLLPTQFIQFLQAPEDYSDNKVVSIFTRLLRYGLMLLTLFFPGFYISVTSFNPDMIPAKLADAISQYRTGVTFPTFIETILMLIAFEILLEAGNRMPKNIGQAVSIVGALIVGEAAVTAKVVSPSVVIVVALTAISGFSMPNYNFGKALRMWRFLITIVSSIVGLVGLVFSFIFFIFHLVRLENFDVPYMAPLVSTDNENMRDVFFKPDANQINQQSKYHESIKRGGH